MTAATLNLKIEQGTTFRQAFTWSTNDKPVNLTGFKARMQLRENIDAQDFIIELTSENNGINFTDKNNGKFEIYISAIDTGNFTFKHAVYDLEFVAPNTDILRLLQGRVALSAEVTR
ncbi:hypothetical protein [Acinetobacter bereziniae]|uniref:hypothetical protein n=1 Tax=Acinetobacter bereziniae TaxID=106648 RepID=UPI0005750071|nr:hypothetical protein [Acinetobacter bereziniae]CEI51551.1 hypothetical protein [Acinetobacter bereziniae]